MGEMRNILGGLLLAGGIILAHAQVGVDISGTLSDAKSGAAVAGAKVSLAANPGVMGTTGADGAFHLTGTVAIAAAKAGKGEMAFMGNQLAFSVAENNTPVIIDLFNLKSEHVRNLLTRSAPAGRYTVNAAPADLAQGVYLVRARVGGRTAAFKMSAFASASLSGNPVRDAGALRLGLAKAAAEPVDSLLVTKDGYKPMAKAITRFTGIFPLQIVPKLTTGDLKIVSERNFPQVDWGANVDVQVWDGGTQLNGGYKPGPFEGTQSWMVTFTENQSYNGWGFVAKDATPEDMSAWKNGSMHLAVKGTATSIGVTMASDDQGESSVKVDLRSHGYLPDNLWHEIVIPLSDFTGTNFARIHTYCGLVYPVIGDSAVYDASLFYQVDDIYWKTTK